MYIPLVFLSTLANPRVLFSSCTALSLTFHLFYQIILGRPIYKLISMTMTCFSFLNPPISLYGTYLRIYNICIREIGHVTNYIIRCSGLFDSFSCAQRSVPLKTF